MARYRIAGRLGSYRTGDAPGALTVELESVEAAALIALDGVTGVTAEIVSPAGVATPAPASADAGADTITVTVPGALAEAGLWTLELAVTTAGGTVGVEPAAFVVEAARDGWHTLASARAEWKDAPRSDASLFTYLAGARGQITEYAPALEAGARPPLNYRQAQLMQARNCWNAANTDPQSGGIGGEEFTFRPYPMDATIRYLLRPRLAVGSVA